MKSISRAIGLVVWATLLTIALTPAQGARTGRVGLAYDPATETTFKGTVQTGTQGGRGQMIGTHLTVKAGDEIRSVLLGPASFVTSKGFSFAAGDLIEVTGSSVTMGGETYFVARQVVKDGKTLTLRDKNGTPEWASSMGRGHGMRKPQ